MKTTRLLNILGLWTHYCLMHMTYFCGLCIVMSALRRFLFLSDVWTVIDCFVIRACPSVWQKLYIGQHGLDLSLLSWFLSTKYDRNVMQFSFQHSIYAWIKTVSFLFLTFYNEPCDVMSLWWCQIFFVTYMLLFRELILRNVTC